MWRKKIPTNYGLWVSISTVLFFVLASVNWVPEGKTVSYLGLWSLLFDRGGFAFVNGDFPFVLFVGGIMHALPAVALGWVCQAIIMTIRVRK